MAEDRRAKHHRIAIIPGKTRSSSFSLCNLRSLAKIQEQREEASIVTQGPRPRSWTAWQAVSRTTQILCISFALCGAIIVMCTGRGEMEIRCETIILRAALFLLRGRAPPGGGPPPPPPPPPAVPISVSIMQDRMRKTVRLRSLMPRSFLSVFGKENLEWSDDEAEGKATTSSKAEAHEKESPIKPRCHLLKTHAKELNMLKRMGFKDRRKNKAVTNSRARNHEAPPPPPPSTQHCTKYLGAALDMG